NKKCIVNAEVFRTILNICLRVEGEDFIDVPNDDIALTLFVDHMHQLWRTLAAIINKCLSRKTASNDVRDV
ncbi:hypothetical protein Tco_1205558, partial [Tanacetum coccineum]